MSVRLCSDRSAIALVAVLLVMALLTGIGAGLTAAGVVEFRTSMNHRSATQALLLADAGATHAQALLRGPLSGYTYTDLLLGADGVPGTEDDGILDGFALAAADALPDTGIVMGPGRYYARLVNDPGDPSGDPFTDTNDRMVAICRGEIADGGRAEVRVMLAAPEFPAIATNGDLILPGIPTITGECGGVHANGTLQIDGNPIISGDVSASDTIILSGVIHDEYGNVVTPRYEPPIEVPEYDPLELCGEAEYVLRDGWVITVGPPRDSVAAGGPSSLGWSYDPLQNLYSLNGSKAQPGTVCAYGNVQMGGNIGKDGAPLGISVLATGSVKVTGTPWIEADHSEGMLIVAGGDLQFGGNAGGSTPNYSGMLYSGGQCQINGTPLVNGHILCYDDLTISGAINLVDENTVNGNPDVTYDCSGTNQRTLVAAWWEVRTQ